MTDLRLLQAAFLTGVQMSNPKNKVIVKILNYTALEFGVLVSEITGPTRRHKVVRARRVIAYLLRLRLTLPLKEIGQIIGGRNHSTVIHGLKIMKDIIENPNIDLLAWTALVEVNKKI